MSEDNPYEDALGTVDRMDQHLANWQAADQPPSSNVGLSLAQSSPGGPGFLEQGLGLAQRGLNAITPTRDTLYKLAQGLEAGAAVGQGRTPLYMQQQQMDLNRQQIQDAADERKQMMVHRIQQAEEQKRQHNWGIAEKLITAGNMGALEEFAKTQFPDAMPIVQGVSKQHLSSLPVLAEGGYIPQDVVQRVTNPKPGDRPMTAPELSMHVKLGMENWQADIKEQAKNKMLTDALNTPAAQRKPHQQLMVDEHQQKLEVQKADVDLKKAQAEKLRKDQEGGNDKVTQTMNGLARGVFLKDAREIQGDEMVTAEDRARVLQHGLSLPPGPISRLTALSALGNVQVPTLMAGNRATAQQTAQLNVPDKPSSSERQNLVDDVGTLSRIDSLHALYSNKYVGPVRGRIGAATEMLGGITEDEADFRAENSTLKNQVIKMITGAQMSEPEAKRIMKQIPDPENPPTVYEARLKRTRENVMMMAQKRRQILQQSGIDVSHLAPLPTAPGAHPAVKSALDEVLGK